MEYRVKTYSSETVFSLMERFGLDSLTSTILAQRGYDWKKMAYFFEEDMIFQHSPFLFQDSFDAVERISDALDENEKIMVYGDRDCDGITSSAIVIRELRRLGAKDNLVYRLPLDDEPYGLTMEIVKEVIDKDVKLLITVDNGITAVEEIRALRKNGVDVIVLDHHLSGEDFPPAYAILDPKVEGSGYPFSDPAACLVSFKTMFALRFQRSPLYMSQCILLHASPENDGIRVEAYRLENLMLTSSIAESISSDGYYSLQESKLMKFLSVNLPIIVYDRESELRLLRKAFGNSVDISIEELRPRLEKLIPQVKGKSLYELSLVSKTVRYSDRSAEMETLLSLFNSYSLYSTKGLMDDLDDSLELVAIGTIADMMNLVDENRLFVKLGLKKLKSHPMKALSYLMARLDLLGRKLRARDISFNLSPVINAAGRMGSPDVALSLLLSDDEKEIETLSEELLALNKDRQRSSDEALSLTEGIAESSYEHFAHKFVLVSDSSIPRGLTGALASRYLKNYHVPSIVIAETEDGKMVASMRSTPSFNSKAFLSRFENYFLYYGGHSAAAGFTLEKDNFFSFLSDLEEHVFSDEGEEEGEEIEIEAVLNDGYKIDDLWKVKESFEPFGQGNPPLLFLVKNAKIVDIAHNRNNAKYLRFSIEIHNEVWPAVFWENDRDEGYYSPGDEVTLIFSPDINYWKGFEKKQILVKAMEKCVSQLTEDYVF